MFLRLRFNMININKKNHISKIKISYDYYKKDQSQFYD